MKFVYCFDKDLADKLSVNLKLLKEDKMGGRQCWIFINDKKITFDNIDKSKVILSNRLNF